jgi:hypothetical protein
MPQPGASISITERPTSENVSLDDIYCHELYALGRGTPFRVPDRFPVDQGAIGVLYKGGFKTYFNAYEPCEGANFTPLPRPPDEEILISKYMEPNIYHSSHFGKKEVVGEITMCVDIPARQCIFTISSDSKRWHTQVYARVQLAEKHWCYASPRRLCNAPRGGPGLPSI